jgi:hypothetical protein
MEPGLEIISENQNKNLLIIVTSAKPVINKNIITIFS